MREEMKKSPETGQMMQLTIADYPDAEIELTYINQEISQRMLADPHLIRDIRFFTVSDGDEKEYYIREKYTVIEKMSWRSYLEREKKRLIKQGRIAEIREKDGKIELWVNRVTKNAPK